MSLTQAGWAAIAARLVGTSVTAFDTGNAYLGVGDASNTFVNTQTQLESERINGTSASHNQRKAMTSGSYPGLSGNVITFQSTFLTSEANFVWSENGIFNASTSGTMLTRAVETLITKTSAVSVVFTKTLTIQS